MITILSRLAMIRLLAGWLALAAGSAHACTTVLVGKAATVDGSVLMATSCDGGIMGRVYVSQVRAGLPAPVSGCMWLTLGPAATGCFAPVYCGTSEIAESWRRPPDFTRIARTGVQWKFQLVEDLVGLKYQEAIEDVRKVFGSAEERFFRLQPELEDAAVQVWKDQGAAGAERFVTAYSNSCLEKVDEAYGELVDFLMFKYLYSYSSAAPPSLPRIGAVAVPAPGGGNRNEKPRYRGSP